MGYMHTSRIKQVATPPPGPTTPTPSPIPSSDFLSSFFRKNNNQAYRVILRLAHPRNTFKSGSVTSSGSNIIVTIYSSNSSNNNLCTKFSLRKDGSYFNSIECIEDDDFVPTFFFTDIIGSILADYIDNIEEVSQIEGYFGINLSNMSAQKACIAILSVLLWQY